jgi:VCBS repeat-containing protein
MMRTLFLLFVLANIGFFAWDRYLRAPPYAGDYASRVQVTPEKIRLLNAPSAQVKVAAACMEWGAFSGADVARADAAIAELDLLAAQYKRVLVDASGHWVYVPPHKSRADADTSAKLLRARGVTEFAVVQEQTQWRHAISLGIFRTDEAAQAFLKTLRAKGVTEAVAERRENFLRQVVYYVREPSETTVAKLAAMRAALPASEVRAVPCPD